MTRMEVYKGHSPFDAIADPRRTGRQEWRWRLRAGNNRIIACSGEAFYSKDDAVRAAARMLTWAEKVPGYGTIRLIVAGKFRREWG